MNRLLIRIGATTAAAMAAGLFLAPVTLADDGGNTCTITDNGAFSHNRCNIRVRRITKTTTINKATVKNVVVVSSDTGGNKANFNTGGNVDVTSGDSTVTVTITNNVNTPPSP